MDSATVAYIVAALVSALGAGVYILVQRQLAKSDREQERKDQDWAAAHRDHGTRMGNMQEHIQALELSLANKVGREELRQLFDKVDQVQRDFKDDMKDLKTEVLNAIEHRRS